MEITTGRQVLVPIAYGSEELEAVTVVDLLRRADINVTVAGDNEMVSCSRAVKLVPDIMIKELSSQEDYDAIVLPGGTEGVRNLIESEILLDLVKYNMSNKKMIGAICAAPLYLTTHKLIDDTITITSFPGVKDLLNHSNYSEDDVVVSNNIVSSRAVGTAIDFALKMIELLTDKNRADEVSQEIYYKRD